MKHRSRGFTLIEVLLATVLLAAGMALAFSIVRSATAISSRGEAIASGNERMRGVENFLRRRLVAAQPLPFASDPDNGTSTVFSGDERQLRFVAEVPAYFGRGGPYLHALEVVDEEGGKALHIGLTLLQGGQLLEENPPRAPEVLADGLKDVRLAYRGIDPDSGALGQWQPQWQVPGRMPLLVSVEIIPADGKPWPPLVVALPQQGAARRWP